MLLSAVLVLLCGFTFAASARDCKDYSAYCSSYRPAATYCHPSFYNYGTLMRSCPKHCSICTEQCGMSQAANGRVIGGFDTNAATWPWNVAIFYQTKFICGGVLISNRYLLTSAACVKNKYYGYLKVQIGDTDLTKRDGELSIRVKRIIRHPSHVGNGNFNHNIALLRLQYYARYGKRVQPICLPKANKSPKVGSICYLTGWGKRQAVGGKFSNAYPILQQVALKITSNKQCHFKNSKAHPITSGMLCAERTNNFGQQGACYGDFGSPLVCKQSNGSWMLHGIVSWIHTKCNTNVLDTVFSRVSSYRKWIDKYVKV